MDPGREGGVLFVYGSLRRGAAGGMVRLLQPGTQPLGIGRMRGRLVDLGAYPGLVSASRGWVVGELHLLVETETVLERLDRYEGCGPDDRQPHEFERVQRPARRLTGGELPAWVYVFRGDPRPHRVIRSGDYLARGQARRVL